MNIKFKILLGLVLLSSSCAHSPKIQEFPNTASPQVEIKNLENEILQAKNNQVDVLSYKNFKTSDNLLEHANKNYYNQKSDKSTLYLVAKGKAYLDLANDGAKISHNYIPEVIAARQKAFVAGAETNFKDELKDIDKKLVNITTDLERNWLRNYELNAIPLQSEYLALELKSIKESNLAKSANLISTAKKEGASQYAPRTLAIAEKAYNDAENYITGNRYNKTQINILINDLNLKAAHVLKITKDSKVGDRTSSEDTSLRIESEKNELRSSHKQYVQNMELGLEEEKNITLETQNKLYDSKIRAENLTQRNENLKAEQVFALSFDNARSEFTSSEAEVYKKGDTLVIRLKELTFPSSKSYITDSNFKLLSKVSNVIKSFDNCSVIIEGHTDSIGNESTNNKLSLDRANSVREYLVSNGVIDASLIKTTGYGFQKPLTSNKTAEGRSINRRVDILIKPVI